jgi:competence protein ComEC
MIANHKGEIPFVVLLLPFLAGITIGLYLNTLYFLPLLKTGLAVFTIAFVGLNIIYKRLALYRFRWIGGMLIHFTLFILGWVVTLNYNELNHYNHFSKEKANYLVIRINGEPKANNGISRFIAVAEESIADGKQTRVSGNLLIAIKDSSAKSLKYGDELLIPANYRLISGPLNPAEFNYKQYMANQNIHYQAFLYPHQFSLLRQNAGNAIIARSFELRQYLVDKLKTHMHSPEAIAVTSTLILGYKADLSNGVLQAYSKTGTVHVLSVSGAHVAIIYASLEFLLAFLTRFRYGKTAKAVIIILLVGYYSLLTGFSPAVCRAAFMISMVIIGKTYSRNINTLNILAVSAFFLLLYDPLFITDVGFQLSYLAVAGLIILQPVIYKWFDIENKWIDKLWFLCSASIAAQLITFPLSAFYFHQFPVYFLISNLLIIVPSAVIMYSGLAYLILPSIPFISGLLVWVLEKSILLMNRSLAYIEFAPFAGINKIWIRGYEYWLLYLLMTLVFYYLYSRKLVLLKLSLLTLLALSASISFKRWKNSTSDNVVSLNLKKHRGIILKKGNSALVLTDVTDTDKVYKYSIQPYLDSCQVANVKLYNTKCARRSSYLLNTRNIGSLK